MVDFSKGPMLYGAIGGGAVIVLLLLVCCCCRSARRKDDEPCLTPNALHDSKLHYVLDVDAVQLTSPAGAHTHLPRKSLTSTDTEGLAVPTMTSPPSREARKSSVARDSELFGTMRASRTIQPRKSSSNEERESLRDLAPPATSQPPSRKSSIVVDIPTLLEGDSLTEPFQAPSSDNGSEPDALEVMPTSPVEPSSRRASFVQKETEVASAMPTSPVEPKPRRAMLAATDIEWYRAMPTSPICHTPQRLSRTTIETEFVSGPPSPICHTPRHHLTPRRKKSVTFDMPEDDDPKPKSRPTTPRSSRSSILAASRFAQPVDPLAIAEDPVVVASRLPFETIRRLERIGQDGFGEVYRGTYRDSVVAVKRLLRETRRDVTKIHAMLQEVKLMATMDHVHIVQFIGVAWDSFSDVCVVTEYMAGGDLRSALDHFDKLGRPLGFDKQKATIALHVAHALTYLHSLKRTVLYRDFKSKNIFLNGDQTLAKLTSCSVSKEWQDGTMSAGVGTALWMAPEVMTGQKYDDKADVFSFGIVLSELDTYLLPYADFSPSDLDDDAQGRQVTSTVLLHRILAGKATVTFSKELRSDVRALGEACIQLDPAKRPTSAEVLYELQKIERTMESEISIVL